MPPSQISHDCDSFDFEDTHPEGQRGHCPTVPPSLYRPVWQSSCFVLSRMLIPGSSNSPGQKCPAAQSWQNPLDLSPWAVPSADHLPQQCQGLHPLRALLARTDTCVVAHNVRLKPSIGHLSQHCQGQHPMRAPLARTDCAAADNIRLKPSADHLSQQCHGPASTVRPSRTH